MHARGRFLADVVPTQRLARRVDAGGLGAELNAPSLAQLDRLEQLLADAGMSSKVLSASEEGGVATARVELRTQ